MPCATRILGADGHSWGIAGIDVTYEDLARDSLNRDGSIGVRDAMLLDNDGRVVISASAAATPTDGDDSKLALEAYRLEPVLRAVRERHPGGVIRVPADQHLLVVFQRLESLGWYYAEEVDAGSLFP